MVIIARPLMALAPLPALVKRLHARVRFGEAVHGRVAGHVGVAVFAEVGFSLGRGGWFGPRPGEFGGEEGVGWWCGDGGVGECGLGGGGLGEV